MCARAAVRAPLRGEGQPCGKDTRSCGPPTTGRVDPRPPITGRGQAAALRLGGCPRAQTVASLVVAVLVFVVAVVVELAALALVLATASATANAVIAYVTNFNSNSVTPIAVATNTPGTPIPVGSQPSGIAITPDGKRADADGHQRRSTESASPLTHISQKDTQDYGASRDRFSAGLSHRAYGVRGASTQALAKFYGYDLD